jgi:preprotein translocase subunit YajC
MELVKGGPVIFYFVFEIMSHFYIYKENKERNKERKNILSSLQSCHGVISRCHHCEACLNYQLYL